MRSRRRRGATRAGVAVVLVMLAAVVPGPVAAAPTTWHPRSSGPTAPPTVAAVRDQVRQLAVRYYVQGTSQITRLLRMADANAVVLAQQYASVVAETSTEALEQYRADEQDLRIEVTALGREQESRADAIDDLRRRQVQAVEELERLALLEEQARAVRQEEQRRADAPAAVAGGAGRTPAAGRPTSTSRSTPAAAGTPIPIPP